MNIALDPGTYVVAVSGGVDSMVLLDVLRQQPGLRLIVAHFDHGIRDDSMLDRRLVQEIAAQHRLPFVFATGKLGAGASEDEARRARYEFLQTVRKNADALAVLTAHHQDDVLETAIINLLRGTGPRGLTALRDRERIIRPLLHVPKTSLCQYAEQNNLQWREDTTNQSLDYHRNYVRQKIVPRLGEQGRTALIDIVHAAHQSNAQISALTAHHLHLQPAVDVIERRSFIQLPHSVARHVLASWLRKNGIRSFDKKHIDRLVTAMKTGKSNTTMHILGGARLHITKDTAVLEKPKSV